MLKLCITFDYELFLGTNTLPEEEVLFRPAKALAEMLAQEGVPATFFADTCSVTQHARFGQTAYCDGFTAQLRELYAMGHDVQLHIHPNWLNSRFQDGAWEISAEGYKIHDFGFDPSTENSAPTILRGGKTYLEETLRPVDPAYRCIAYRAGGFCIRPEQELLRVLLSLGIRIDSSVALRQVSQGAIQDYDFSRMPPQLNWWVSPDKGLEIPTPRGDDTVFEVAIGTARNNLFKYLGLPKDGIHVTSRSGAGSGIVLPSRQSGRFETLCRMVKRRLWSDGILSLDTRGYAVLLRDLDEIFRRYGCGAQDQYAAIICHPKLASEQTVENMRRFVRAVKRRPEDFGFTTMQMIAKEQRL